MSLIITILCLAILPANVVIVNQSNYQSLPNSKEYHIVQPVDLCGFSLIFPDNSTLFFSRNGCFKNGTICGNGLTIKSSRKSMLFARDLRLEGSGWTADIAYSQWFGAVADCKLGQNREYIAGTNNFQAFQNLFLFDNVRIKKGCYYVKGNLRTTRSNQVIDGCGAIIKGAFINRVAGILTIGQHNFTDGITSGVVVNDLTFIGIKNETNVETEWGHGVVVVNSDNVILDNVDCIMCKGDGFNITERFDGKDIHICTNINLMNCAALYNYRCGVSITGGHHIILSNCNMSFTEGTNPQAGIDIEPNRYTSAKGKQIHSPCTDIRIDSCIIMENAKYGLKIDSHENKDDLTAFPVKNIRVLNCLLSQNSLSVWRVDSLLITGCELVSDRLVNGIVFQNEDQKNIRVEKVSIKNTSEDVPSALGIYMSPGHRRYGFVFVDIEISGAFKYGFYIPRVKVGDVVDDFTFRNITVSNCWNGFFVGEGAKNTEYENIKSVDHGLSIRGKIYDGWSGGWSVHKDNE